MSKVRNDKLLKKIALLLKELRSEKNLTQDDVFEETKIHIGRIEAAKINISVSTLLKLCSYYELSLADFFERIKQ